MNVKQHASKKVIIFSSRSRKGSDMQYVNFRTGKQNDFPISYFVFNRNFPFSPDLEIIVLFSESRVKLHCRKV